MVIAKAPKRIELGSRLDSKYLCVIDGPVCTVVINILHLCCPGLKHSHSVDFASRSSWLWELIDHNWSLSLCSDLGITC